MWWDNVINIGVLMSDIVMLAGNLVVVRKWFIILVFNKSKGFIMVVVISCVCFLYILYSLIICGMINLINIIIFVVVVVVVVNIVIVVISFKCVILRLILRFVVVLFFKVRGGKWCVKIISSIILIVNLLDVIVIGVYEVMLVEFVI